MTKPSGSVHVKDWVILEMYRLMHPHWSLTHNAKFVREHIDLMVKCLTRDRRVTGSRLTCGTAAVCVLEQDTFISSKYCFNLA